MNDPLSSHTPHWAVIQSIFRAFDEAALGAFRRVEAKAKADGTAVTVLDLETSQMVSQALTAHTPGHEIISEEDSTPRLTGAEWRWVIDPLDGTASFARGYPVWCLGIGLMEGGKPREGYLRFPALDETYACAGGAATFNGSPARPPTSPPLPDTQVYLVDSSLHKWLGSHEPLLAHKLRSFGSNLYHMACLALGRAEAMICGRVYLWDLAPALPMTRAAGLVERYVDGEPFEPGELGAHNGFRIRMPLVIAPPEPMES
ncbi:MAG: inositol monophosphatase, partial [bacterium]